MTIPAAYLLGGLTLAQVYAVIFVNGSLSVFFHLSTSTLFVSMVERERYIEGQALLTGTRAFSFLAGPAVGGVLVHLFRAPLALLLDALSFLGSAFLLWRIKPVEPATTERAAGQLLGGARFILGSPVMRASLLATATINLFQLGFGAIQVLYLVRELHLQPATIGLIAGLGSSGGLLGSALTSRIARRIGIGPAYLAGCILFPAPLLAIPLVSGPQPLVIAVLVAAVFFTAFGVMLLDTCAGAIAASLIPNQLRARVMGAYTLVNYGVRPLGGLLGGWLGAAIGLREALVLLAALAVAGFLWLLPSPLLKLREPPAAA